MDSGDKKRLKVNFAEIVRTVKVGEVIDYMFGEDILNEDDMDQLDENIKGMSQKERTRKFMRILPKRGAKAFSVFMAALREEDYSPWLADKIEQTDISQMKEVDEVDNFSEKEKLCELNNQILDQAAILSQMHREKEEYRQQLQAALQQRSTGDVQSNELKETMKKFNLTEELVVEFITQQLQTQRRQPRRQRTQSVGDDMRNMGDDMPPRNRELRRPSVIPAGGDVGYDESDYYEMTEIESIAREIGRYIVHTMMFPDVEHQAPNKYAQRMRLLVQDVMRDHETAFEHLLKTIYFDEINGFDTLINVGNQVFLEGDGQANWGRVIVYFAFGGYIAKNFGANDPSIADSFGDFLGFFIGRSLEEWIVKEGGWDNFYVRFVEEKSRDSGGGRLSTLWSMVGGTINMLNVFQRETGANP